MLTQPQEECLRARFLDTIKMEYARAIDRPTYYWDVANNKPGLESFPPLLALDLGAVFLHLPQAEFSERFIFADAPEYLCPVRNPHRLAWHMAANAMTRIVAECFRRDVRSARIGIVIDAEGVTVSLCVPAPEVLLADMRRKPVEDALTALRAGGIVSCGKADDLEILDLALPTPDRSDS